MNFKLGLTLVASACIYFTANAQNGFTQKEEATNKYINGFKEGKWIEYADSSWNFDNPKQQIYYRLVEYKNGKPFGIVRDFYMSGQLEMEGRFTSFIPPLRDGVVKEYYKNGNLKSESYYTNGKASAPGKRYYEDGNLSMMDSTMIAGGKLKFYFKGGNLQGVDSGFVNGKFNGVQKWYYESGVMQMEVPYKNDKKNGLQKWYDEVGNLTTAITYTNDRKNGDAFFFKQRSWEIFNNDTVTASGTLNDGLCHCIRIDKMDDVKLLLGNGVYVNGEGTNGNTAMCDAMNNPDTTLIKFLLKNGADINGKSGGKYGEYPICKYLNTTMILSQYGGQQPDTILIKFMIKNGADINANRSGGTALFKYISECVSHIANPDIYKRQSYDPDTTFIKFLLSQGADINAKADYWGTPLMYCITTYHYDHNDKNDPIFRKSLDPFIKFLVDHGADVNCQDNLGYSALDRAKDIKERKDGDSFPYEVLRKQGAKKGNHKSDHDGSAFIAVAGVVTQTGETYLNTNPQSTAVTDAMNQSITNINNMYSQQNTPATSATSTSSGNATQTSPTSSGNTSSSTTSGTSGTNNNPPAIKYATACGSGCGTVSLTMTSAHHCGNSDYNYTLKNNTSNSIDIALYVKKTDGSWIEVGEFDNVASGAIIDAAWECNASSTYITYYREAGSKDTFMSASQVGQQFH